MVHTKVSFEEDSHNIDKDVNSHDQYHEVMALWPVISPYDCMQMPLWKNIIRKPT